MSASPQATGAASLAMPAELRPLVWLVAVLIDAVGPLLATLRDDKLPMHIEHLPERVGLLVILVLGEAVGATARGVHDAGWAVPSLLTGLIGFGVAAALWWIYFDVAAAASARQLEEPMTVDRTTPPTAWWPTSVRHVRLRSPADDPRGGADRHRSGGDRAASVGPGLGGGDLAARRGSGAVPVSARVAAGGRRRPGRDGAGGPRNAGQPETGERPPSRLG